MDIRYELILISLQLRLVTDQKNQTKMNVKSNLMKSLLGLSLLNWPVNQNHLTFKDIWKNLPKLAIFFLFYLCTPTASKMHHFLKFTSVVGRRSQTKIPWLQEKKNKQIANDTAFISSLLEKPSSKVVEMLKLMKQICIAEWTTLTNNLKQMNRNNNEIFTIRHQEIRRLHVFLTVMRVH